jgi:hypothetical protein
VDFVIIGATAFPVYGYVRATLDTDIFIRPDKSNAERALSALKEFGYDMRKVYIYSSLIKILMVFAAADKLKSPVLFRRGFF